MVPSSARWPTPAGSLYISTSSRQYYRSQWGFDPINDWVKRGSDLRALEAWFSLEADPSLAAAGVEIGARVIFNLRSNTIHNEIAFRCRPHMAWSKRYRESAIECIHTILFCGPLDDAIRCNEETPHGKPEPIQSAIRSRRAIRLPPWEHFAALKSFVSALAEMGIINLLQAAHQPEAIPPESLPYGFNTMMQAQVLRALSRVAPLAGSALLRDFFLELIDTAPKNWLHCRLPLLSKLFHYDIKSLEIFRSNK
jgi:hypothetical protein